MMPILTPQRVSATLMVVVVCLLAAATSASGQNVFEYGPFKLQRFTEADGLVSSDVTGIYRDLRGFLWVSTFNGVSRFDGRTFENFNRENGLPEGNVAIMGEDKSGQLYINSINGIYRYTGNASHPFLKYPTSGAFLQASIPDSAGLVWVCYEASQELTLLSPQGPIAHLSLASPVVSFASGHRGEIYVLQEGGRISMLKGGSLVTVNQIRPILPYLSNGIRLFTDAQKRVWSYGANNTHAYQYNDGHIVDSIAIPRSKMWWQWVIGAGSNLYKVTDSSAIYQLINGKLQSILTRSQIMGSLQDMVEEKDGLMWVCCSGGLLKISRKQYDNIPAANAVYYFSPGKTNDCFLKVDSLLEGLPNASKYYWQLSPPKLTYVYVTQMKDVWYCTREAVYRLPYGKSIQRLNTGKTYAGPDILFGFRRVQEDTLGGMWISSYHGIFYYHNDGRLDYYYDREGIAENALYALNIDRTGTVYIAGVRVYALRNGRFQNISPQLGLVYEVTRLAKDHFGNLWVCQGQNRIIRIGQRNDGRFFAADSLQLSVNGQPFAAQYICFDTANNLWITDNRSLYLYKYANGNYRNAGYPVLWDENFSGNPALYTDGGDHLTVLSWPVEGNYLRTYSLKKLQQGVSRDYVSVQLTGLRLFREPYDWSNDGFSTDPLGIPIDLVLNHSQNFLKFYFSGLSADSRHGVAYRYQLKGFDRGWSPPTEAGEAEYTGLPPGSYTFEVQARSTAGTWSAPLRYSFRIATAWYFTWWAWACWVLAGLGMTTAFIYAVWRVLSKRANLRKLVVEEQLKALRAQINPHFLQNTFSFLAHEIATAPHGHAVKSIDQLSVYLRNVLRFSDLASVTLEEELEFAEEYLRLQQHLMSVPFTYGICINPDVDVFDIRTPSMLLQPIIENALKHGLNARAENRVTISVIQENDWIKCTISDTGNGRALMHHVQHARNSGKGVALTIDRLRLYYSRKKHPPQFLHRANAQGGSDVIILIPLK